MSQALEVLDDQGNVIPPPAPDHPVMALIYLLEYARKHSFRVGPIVEIGDLKLQVADMWQAREAAGQAAPRELDVWEEHGHTETQE